MATNKVKDPELREQLERLEKRFGSVPDDSLQDQKSERSQKGKVIRLPVWPDHARGVPNSMLRGALFAAIQGKDRRYIHNERLEMPKGMEVHYTGWQLDQADLDVWEQAVQLVLLEPLGTRCYFTVYSFLKALGRTTGGDQHEWLKDVFRRLTACALEITKNRVTYGGNLLEFFRDEVNGSYVLSLNPTIMALYAEGWTAIDWEQRQKLRRKPLALWLQGFYASHADSYPLKVETIHRLCGSNTKRLRKFKENLIEALKELVAVGVIVSFEIKDDLVLVERTPSRSQRKHMIKAHRRKK